MRSPQHHARVPALVVAGMHRSGTSFLASLLHAAGCHMGGALLPADAHNQRGYFEDVEFLDLNRRMLNAAVAADPLGHADWGWTDAVEASPVPLTAFDPFAAEADALIARRLRAFDGPATAACPQAVCWGWKDPRTTVLLDFWDQRLASARYVFIYRNPWDVADSMQRLGADVFLRAPGLAYRIWHHYNRALLAFAERHRDRVVLVHSAAALRAPAAVLSCVRERFGVDLAPDAINDVADASLLSAAPADLARLNASLHVECTHLLRALDDAADLPGPAEPPPPLTAPPTTAAPAVSVVIPCFNDGAFLAEAVASVERAVLVPYDLTLVDDGSEERQTVEVLLAFERAGYRVLRLPHRGLAHARNRGIADSRSDAVLPLDADNRLRPDFVEAALTVLAARPEVMAVYGDRQEFGLRHGRVVVDVPDLDRLLCGNYIDACAVLRRDAWRACGGYDEAMPAQGHEDWDLWLSMLERGFVLHRLDMVAFDYRVRPDSMLARATAPGTQADIERYVLAKHAPLYLAELRRHVDRFRAASASAAPAQRSLGAAAGRLVARLTRRFLP